MINLTNYNQQYSTRKCFIYFWKDTNSLNGWNSHSSTFQGATIVGGGQQPNTQWGYYARLLINSLAQFHTSLILVKYPAALGPKKKKKINEKQSSQINIYLY